MEQRVERYYAVERAGLKRLLHDVPVDDLCYAGIHCFSMGEHSGNGEVNGCHYYSNRDLHSDLGTYHRAFSIRSDIERKIDPNIH